MKKVRSRGIVQKLFGNCVLVERPSLISFFPFTVDLGECQLDPFSTP